MADCPPFQKRGLDVVVSVFALGCLCSSSATPTGWRYTRPEYVSPDGRRTRLNYGPGKRSSLSFISRDSERGFEVFFVGTKVELNKSWGSQPKTSDIPYLWQTPERR